MLKSAPFPHANEEWENTPVSGKTWSAWKTLYKRAQNQERVRAQINGDSAFAATGEGATQEGGQEGESPGKDPPAQVTLEDLEACFDNLACAAKADQDSIAELVKANAALVKTNKDLTTALAKLAADARAAPNTSRKRGGRGRGGGGGGEKDGEKCPICNKAGHGKAGCWELPENASKRPDGWKSVL